jgi:hypothetical protein
MTYFNSISRINKQADINDFIDAADPIYGTGSDGNAVLNGIDTVLGMVPGSEGQDDNVYSMTRDMYFHNLTINDQVRLAPKGYRIFVKNMLMMHGTSIIGFTSGWSTPGSIYQGGAALQSVTHSLGGSGNTTTATPPLESLGGTSWWTVPHQAIKGYSITASGGPTWLRGGAGGSGEAGGGVVIIAARYISGFGSIAAPATPPAGGGVILIVSSAPQLPYSIETDVTGDFPGTVNYMQLV